MTKKVLFVDDDTNILAAYRRALRKTCALTTAAGGAEGLRILAEDGPFAVVISDMQMPEMNGLEFLKEVAQRAPDTVRVMLTGNADQKTAVDAVNEGSVFRFCNKPCPPEEMAATIDTALEHHRLIKAEKTLLEHTLAGSVKVLVDVLSLVDPGAFRRTERLRGWAKTVAGQLGLANAWELDLAAMLSPVGDLTLPAEVREKRKRREALNGAEMALVRSAPEAAHKLIGNIPRLGAVAEMILDPGTRSDGSGFPDNDVAGADIPVGARILKILNDLNAAADLPRPSRRAFEALKRQATYYDPELLAKIESWLAPRQDPAADGPQLIEVAIDWLLPGDVIEADIVTEDDQLVLAAGYEVTNALIEKLASLRRVKRIKQPIAVLRDAQPGDGSQAAANAA